MKSLANIALNANIHVCERDERMLFKDLSLHINNGDFIQIAGANGCGKTTLLKLLAGLNHSYTGQLNWHKQPLQAQFHDYAQNRLYLGHLSAIKLTLTCLENLRWLASPWQVSANTLNTALAEVKLYGYEDSLCQTLSAGQKRRVALALLLCSPAPLWILDEPFTALDSEGVEWLIKQMQQHVAKGGAVVVTSHHALTNVACSQRIELGN